MWAALPMPHVDATLKEIEYALDVLKADGVHMMTSYIDHWLGDKAFAINSMQVWPDAMAGLVEMRRVVKSGGTVALAFTPPSGQPKQGLVDTITAAGFSAARMVETDNFCALATRP